jgi:DnaK suppressor protein
MLVHPETAPAPGSRTPRGAGRGPDASIDQRSEEIRGALVERFEQLRVEHADAVAEMTLAGTIDAGDDVADLGTKAFSREQEYALAETIRGRMEQVERALDRLNQGQYGRCESCAKEIPVARLAAYPAATLCVSCKAADERR